MRVLADNNTECSSKLHYSYLRKIVEGGYNMAEALDRYNRAIMSKQVGDMQEINFIIARYEAEYGDKEDCDPAIVNQMCAEIEKI